jgi:hypothetical protein
MSHPQGGAFSVFFFLCQIFKTWEVFGWYRRQGIIFGPAMVGKTLFRPCRLPPSLIRKLWSPCGKGLVFVSRSGEGSHFLAPLYIRTSGLSCHKLSFLQSPESFPLPLSCDYTQHSHDAILNKNPPPAARILPAASSTPVCTANLRQQRPAPPASTNPSPRPKTAAGIRVHPHRARLATSRLHLRADGTDSTHLPSLLPVQY